MSRLLALLILFVGTQAAVAWPFHGDGGAAPTVQLASVAVTFGNRTLSGYGEVQLNSQDIDYGTGYIPKGLDVLVSGSCAKWSTSQTGGTAGHFNVISHVADGASAVTPNPTAAGATAQLNGGPYTFLVTCEDSSNAALATATLTYNISTGTANNCGAINIGQFDNTGVAYFPSGFASTLDGCAVYLSTGYSRTSRFVLGMPFAHAVTYTCADGASRCGVLVNLETNSANSTHVLFKDINISGPTNTGVGNAAFVLAGTDINADNIHAYSSATIRSAGSYQCIKTDGSTGGTVTHFGCDWLGGFFTPSNNYTYQYGYARHANQDAIISPGYTHDFHVKDVTILSFNTPASPGIHPDAFQISDGGTPWDYSIERLMVIQAGGDIYNQGPPFGGGVSGANNSWTGFVSDSTCSGAAGQTLCNITGGAQSNADGSKIYSTAGTPVGLTDGVTVSCGGTPCPFNTVFVATGSGTNLTVSSITTSGASIAIGSLITGSGVTFGTTIVSQTSGTAGKTGVYVTSQAATSSAASLNTVSKYTLVGLSGNITYGTSGSPVNFYGITNKNATWDMVWDSGGVVIGTQPSGFAGVSSLKHFNNIWQETSGATGGNGSPRLHYIGCLTTAIWTGALTVDKGAQYNTQTSDCGSNVVPGNTTQTNVFNAGLNTTTLASWYVNGDPKTCLEAKTATDWNNFTVQAAMVYAASCTIVKTGGALDLTTDVANSIGTSLTPKWADGQVVGTGFTGY